MMKLCEYKAHEERIATAAEFAAEVLQPFPHFIAACKPIFDAVKDEKEK